MHAFFTLPALHPLMLGCTLLAAALLMTGCAVPVADPYGYGGPAYPAYPAYPPASYLSPAEPAYMYGAPPLFLGGQVWIDPGPGRNRHGWRDSDRRSPDWRQPQWPYHRPGNNTQPRPHDHQQTPIPGGHGGRRGQLSPDNMQRPHAQDRGHAERADRSQPAGRERGAQGEGRGGREGGGGRWRDNR